MALVLRRLLLDSCVELILRLSSQLCIVLRSAIHIGTRHGVKVVIGGPSLNIHGDTPLFAAIRIEGVICI